MLIFFSLNVLLIPKMGIRHAIIQATYSTLIYHDIH